jgi:protein phosphatase
LLRGGRPKIRLPSRALVICCGPAASGKSTFARRHFSANQIVSSDRCRALIGGDEANQTVSGRAFDLFHRTIEHRLALGQLTVADSTAISPRARSELCRLARRHGRPVVLLAFDLGLAACFRNNHRRLRRVPRCVIRDQRLRFREQGSRFERENYFAVYRLTTRTVGAARVQFAAP